MAGDTSATHTPSDANPKKPHLHPAFTATNVHQKIRVLDGTKTPYSNWVKLFKNHLKIYKLLHHIDGTKTPSQEDPAYDSWLELDALILQWIYSMVSDEILNRILDDNTTSRQAWIQIQEIFINNKHARAATLEKKFTNATLTASASFDDYCQTLKDIARQLGDIDQPVSESRLFFKWFVVSLLNTTLSVLLSINNALYGMSLGAWSKPNNNDRRLDPIPTVTRPLFIPPPPPITPKATPLQRAPTTIVLPTRTDIVATTTTLPKPHAAGDEAEDFLAEEGVDLTINISGVPAVPMPTAHDLRSNFQMGFTPNITPGHRRPLHSLPNLFNRLNTGTNRPT